MVVDIPKDVQFAKGTYYGPKEVRRGHTGYRPAGKGSADAIRHAVALMARAERPVLYTGGGVINSGPAASQLLRELVAATGFPITSTLMGLGAYPASGKNWLGMLGMHGTYEANMAMHDCDLMICIGARFDDRITGRIDAFSPGSRKIHVDVDASSINKNIRVDVPIVGDAGAGDGGHADRLEEGGRQAEDGTRSRPGGTRSSTGGDGTRSPTGRPSG